MFSEFDSPVRQILTGNLLLVVCCAFYLAWWLIAFHPTRGIRGFRTGWLLIPACIFGVWAVFRIASGCRGADALPGLLPGSAILIGGILAYAILLAGSVLLAKRPVTSELLLFIAWCSFFFWEVSTLAGRGCLARGSAIALLVLIAAITLVSFVCYLFYYRLDAVRGYVDGMIPLILTAAGTGAVTACVIF